MEIALQNGKIKITNVDNVRFTTIKSWNMMRWDKKSQMLIGTANLELLDKLITIYHLPPALEGIRQRMHAVQDAVDRERINPNPEPLYDFPVKVPLYKHQIRGADMALLTFGMIEPPKGGGGNH